ncbi:conserved hypothetical protein [Ricinus communis]|uniref:Uncharacterized protein n=1 Tax=Ricinus communis TaxID=3988 RepID=B9T6G4_RICCO|nr:conserved hypothetical protein [Ricinus communis]
MRGRVREEERIYKERKEWVRVLHCFKKRRMEEEAWGGREQSRAEQSERALQVAMERIKKYPQVAGCPLTCQKQY